MGIFFILTSPSTLTMRAILCLGLLFLLAISVAGLDWFDYFNQFNPCGNYCECETIILRDERTQQNIGNCLTSYQGRFWCYVSANSQCPDKRPSPRANGLYASYVACDLRGNRGIPYTA